MDTAGESILIKAIMGTLQLIIILIIYMNENHKNHANDRKNINICICTHRWSQNHEFRDQGIGKQPIPNKDYYTRTHISRFSRTIFTSHSLRSFYRPLKCPENFNGSKHKWNFHTQQRTQKLEKRSLSNIQCKYKL